MTKRALITGITGQDGSYLAELLLAKGYEVHGVIRRASTFNTKRIDHLYRDPHDPATRLFLHYGDMTDASNLNRLVEQTAPDEIYNLAAQSHVRVSFDLPEYTGEVDALGTIRLLDAIRDTGVRTKFYQASTSELFGNSGTEKQDEETPFRPRSPYAAAKLYAYWAVRNYREAYGLFACNGILFNHESPRRGETFVTRKITMAAARIHRGLQDCLYLGNPSARRDWGYAPDYVEFMYLLLQQETPGDYVAATGESHSVREFTEEAFARLGHTLEWQTEANGGICALDAATGKIVVRQDARYLRPAEVDSLCGDAGKAERAFGWKAKTSFRELVRIMADADLALLDGERS